MNAAIVKVTYDRKTKTKLSEEIVGTKSISESFVTPLCRILIKGLIEANILGRTTDLQCNTASSDVA